MALKISLMLPSYECSERGASVTFAKVQLHITIYRPPHASPQEWVPPKPLGLQSQKYSSVASDPNVNPAHVCCTGKCKGERVKLG